jgi:disulfide bond formation protein DsbB
MFGSILLIFLIAACGGPKKEETPAPPSAGTSATAPAPAAAVPKGDAVAGKDQLIIYCSACHGPDAKGRPHLGKNLVTSQFFGSKTDAELIAYVKQGRPVNDPLNTTGVPMPPKGGNPALQDQEIANIIAYIRTLRKQAGQ